MRLTFYFLLFFLASVGFLSCAKDQPYLSGHIKRASDAAMTTCDPYNLGDVHTCVVFSSAFKESLYVYNVTAGEMVLSPMAYFPLKVKVGPLTDDLVTVSSDDKKFPFMFAVDRSLSTLYAVRLFPSADKKEKSFETPKTSSLTKAPFKMSAALVKDQIIGILTFPNEQRVELLALKKDSGELEPSIASRSVNVGTKPSHVAIDSDRKLLIISDEGENNLHVWDLANASDALINNAAPAIKHIDVGMKTDRIYLSKRDLGQGAQLYALAFKALGNEIGLINIEKGQEEGKIVLNEAPISGYFPDSASDTCCKGQRQWVSIATIKGKLEYIAIKNDQGKLTLEKADSVDLTSESNLALNKLHIRKILGGAIERDSKVKREPLCPSFRQTIYISSFGNSRIYRDSEPIEVEAHGYSCEGEAAASRFGKAH